MFSRLPEDMLRPDPGPFRDVNFKLAVIDSLIEAGVLNFGGYPGFLRWLEGPQYDYEEHGYVLSDKAYDYFARYPLNADQLARVTRLEFDGGLDIYPFIFPFWGGETEDFDIRSLADLHLLPNLRRFSVISMLTDPDLAPLAGAKQLEVATLGLIGQDWQNMDSLLHLPHLTHVTVFKSDTRSKANQRTLHQLKQRGIVVQTH